MDGDGRAPAPIPAAPARRALLRGGLAAAAGASASALLTGCGSGTSAGGAPKTLKFWNFYAPQTQKDPQIQAQARWFTKLVADWNAREQTKVELVYVPNSQYLNGAKLPTAFAAGEGPDIFLISPGDFLRYYNGGVLAELTPHMDKQAVADFDPAALATRAVNGRVYALPMEVEPLAMFYGVRAWEKAGLSEGDIPTTWDQLLHVAGKLRTKTRPGVVFEVTPGYYQNFTWYPWMWQGGGDVVDRNGNPSFDTRAVRQALDLWGTAVREGLAPRTLPAAGDVIGAFTNDLAGMWQQGIWNVSAFRLAAPKFEYGVFRLPTPDGGRYSTALGGWAFAANAKGRDPDTAARFCAWALGSSAHDSVTRMADWCTVAKSDIAPRRSALALGAARGGYDSPPMKKFRHEIYPGGRAEPRYPPVVYKSVSDAIQAVQLAGSTPAAEARKAQDSLTAYLSTYRGAKLV